MYATGNATAFRERLLARRLPREAVRWGYALTRPGVVGRALLSSNNRGVELVKRLKDAEGALAEETRFWGEQLAAAAGEAACGVILVTHPPSSGKRAHHLATELAGVVAAYLHLPCRSLFTNPNPRGNRASMARKLAEETVYTYQGPATGACILVVDDQYCTGQTALRCVRAARPDRLWFLTLSRS